MMVMGLARAARLMVGGGHLGQVLYQITIIQCNLFIALELSDAFRHGMEKYTAQSWMTIGWILSL